MRIRRIRIEGYRCLSDVEIDFENVTTLIGANGVGKSSVLRAMDWFFNGAASDITDQDLCPTANGRVRVEVEFCEITERDRAELGRYAPAGLDTVRLWRTWSNGLDVFSGNARCYRDFAPIRDAVSAAETKKLYKELRDTNPDLNFLEANTAVAIEQAMVAWETDHPEELTDNEERSTTRFFGFLGGAKLSGLFDYVFVSADLRASEEANDVRNATIGRLIERTIDRAPVVEKVEELIAQINVRQRELIEGDLEEDLDELGDLLTRKVSRFTSGRVVEVEAAPTTLKAPGLQFRTAVTDGNVQTSVARQGHGFQRALLVAALQLVAEKGRKDGVDGTVLLAIEEPELYQHPAQARSFAATLRALAEDPAQSVQVLYATHSPLFIEPGRFDQLRRLRRGESEEGVQAYADVVAGEREHVVEALAGLMVREQVVKQIDKACPQQLAEAVFADAVMLVEGETDRAVFEGVLRRDPELSSLNVTIIEVSGKGSLPLCRAVLAALEISVVVVADTDSNRRTDGVDEPTEAMRDRERQAKDSNRRLLRSFGLPPVDWPAGGFQAESDLLFIDPRLEDWLQDKWPAWRQAREALIAEGGGHEGKHALTYLNAAVDAQPPIPELLQEAVSKLRPR